MLRFNQNEILVIFIIILFIVFIFFLGHLEWSPSYPVEGEVFFRPSSLKVKAPFSGIIKSLNHHQGDNVKKNDHILILENLNYLSIDNNKEKKLHHLIKQSRALKEELAYQQRLLSRLKNLLKNRLLSANEYHLKHQQYYQLLSSYHDVNEKINSFKNERSVTIKAPHAGKLLYLDYKLGDEVSKNKVLLRIQPYKSEAWVKLNIPLDYQEVVQIGQLVKLSKLNRNFIKKFPYEGVIREISFFSKDAKKSNYYVAKAQLKNHDDLPELSPLKGFVIGQPKKNMVLDNFKLE